MGKTADVLLPILGGIAGMNPYLGGGLRTALSVEEALSRSKWEKRQKEIKEEEAADKAASDQRKAEDDADYQKKVIDLVSSVGGDDGRALALLARQDPVKALAAFRKIEPLEPEGAFMTPEQMGEYGNSVEAAFGGDTGQATFRGKHGSVTRYFRPDQAEPTAEDIFVPKKTPVPGARHLVTWSDEEGNVQFEEIPGLKEAMGADEPFADDIETEIREARLEALKADAELQKYVSEKTKEAEESNMDSILMRGGSPEKVPGQPDLTEDAEYRLLQANVDDAYARLRQLAKGAKKPATVVEAEAAQAESDVNTVFYDKTGNPLR